MKHGLNTDKLMTLPFCPCY